MEYGASQILISEDIPAWELSKKDRTTHYFYYFHGRLNQGYRRVIIFLYTIALLLSFYLLYIITEFYFIRSLDRLSQRLNMSSDIAGSTLMAAGSSAPELAVMII